MSIKSIINGQLIGEMNSVINRIPSDLVIWKKECKKLLRNNDSISKHKFKEYSHDYSFYTGKLMAYIYVLQKLDGKIKVGPVASKYIANILKKSNKLAMNYGAEMRIKKL